MFADMSRSWLSCISLFNRIIFVGELAQHKRKSQGLRAPSPFKVKISLSPKLVHQFNEPYFYETVLDLYRRILNLSLVILNLFANIILRGSEKRSKLSTEKNTIAFNFYFWEHDCVQKKSQSCQIPLNHSKIYNFIDNC